MSMADRAPQRWQSAFTLVELLVVLGILALLTAILLPTFSAVREKSRASTCTSNLRQCLLSLKQYVHDNDEVWPHEELWRRWRRLSPNLPHCPSLNLPPADELAAIGHVPGYAYNTAFHDRWKNGPIKDNEIAFPAVTVVLCEETAKQSTAFGPDPWKVMENRPPDIYEDWKRHQGGAHYAFCDGHVKWHLPDDVGYNGAAPNDGARPTFTIFPEGHDAQKL